MTTYTIRVPADAESERVDRHLARALAATCSRSQLQRWIKAGCVTRGGRPVAAADRAHPGDTFAIHVPPPEPSTLAPEPIPLEILYEDDVLLVLNKPAGLVVHPGAGHRGGTLVHGLLHHTRQLSSVAGPAKPGIVHRLDKETSGAMVVAKADAAHRALAKQFADRTVRRTYLALVHGVVPHDTGVIEAPLGRHPKHRQRVAVRPWGQGREAITRWKVLRRFAGATLLELTPATGRTHQLRVHLAHLGFPILGDPVYGRKGHLTRQALHAWKLGFRHPTTGEMVEFTAPLPTELKVANPGARVL